MLESAVAGGGGSLGGLINPAGFDLRSEELDVSLITGAADAVAGIGTNVVSVVDGASVAWSGVSAPGVFETPDQGAVLTLLDPAVAGADAMAGVTSRVASALQTYAAELAPIKSVLAGLEKRAWAFQAEALAGYEVSNMEARGFFGSLGLGTDWVPFVADDAWEMTTIPWNEYGPAIAQNTALVHEYEAIVEKVSTAAAVCASSIQAELTLVCAAPPVVVTAEALAANPDVSTWGSAVLEDRTCTESVGHGFANFGTGIAAGVQAMVGVDARTGVQSWETFGRTWSGVGDFAWSTLVLIPLGVRSMLAGGNLPRGEADYLQDRVNVVASSWGSLIGWDQQAFLAGQDGWHRWEEDGVATFTESAANIGTFFIPVAGVAGGSTKALLAGTRVGSFVVKVGAHAAEFVVPAGSHLVSGVVKAVDLTANGVKGGWRGLIDAIRHTDVDVTVKPSVVPGVVNTAVDAGRVVPPGGSVSEALGLDAPVARPEAVEAAVPPDGAVHDTTVDGIERTEGPGLGHPDAPDSVGAVDPPHPGGEGAGDGVGPSVEDLRRIDRYEQLIDARNSDGTLRYEERVRRFFEGEIFNIENHHRYPVNELHVTKPGSDFYSRIDSFVPDQEVVSRKHTQLAEIDPRTADRYLTEIANKYGLDRREIVVADTPSNRRDLTAAGFDPGDYIGRRLSGQHVLEIPVQNAPPPLDFLLNADARGVTVRDVEGTEWGVSDDGVTVEGIRTDSSDALLATSEG